MATTNLTSTPGQGPQFDPSAMLPGSTQQQTGPVAPQFLTQAADQTGAMVQSAQASAQAQQQRVLDYVGHLYALKTMAQQAAASMGQRGAAGQQNPVAVYQAMQEKANQVGIPIDAEVSKQLLASNNIENTLNTFMHGAAQIYSQLGAVNAGQNASRQMPINYGMGSRGGGQPQSGGQPSGRPPVMFNPTQPGGAGNPGSGGGGGFAGGSGFKAGTQSEPVSTGGTSTAGGSGYMGTEDAPDVQAMWQQLYGTVPGLTNHMNSDGTSTGQQFGPTNEVSTGQQFGPTNENPTGTSGSWDTAQLSGTATMIPSPTDFTPSQDVSFLPGSPDASTSYSDGGF